MSTKNSLLHSVEICCPKCDEYFEISNVDISVIVMGCDIARRIDEAVFDIPCIHCKSEIQITCQLDIDVRLNNPQKLIK